MSVIAVQETWEGREGGVEINGRQSARRSFRVIVDDPRTPIPDILTAVDPNSGLTIPPVGTLHPENFSLYCSGLKPTQRYKNSWEVSADYSNERDRAEDPQDDPVQIEWDTEQFQKPAVMDRDGSAILNAAGDFFYPPPEMDDSRRVVTIRKNMANVPSWILDYQDAVNDAAFTVDGINIATGLAKVQRISVGPVQERNETTFRQVTIVLHLRREGWALETLNRGFRYKSGSNRIKIFFDDSGALVDSTNPQAQPPSEPVLLTAAGAILTDPTPATATYISSDVYYEADFSALPLS